MTPNTTENWRVKFITVIHEFDSEVDTSDGEGGMGGRNRLCGIAEAECFAQLRERFESMAGYEVNDHPDYPPRHFEMEEYCVTHESDPECGFTVMKEVYTHGTFLQWFDK